MSVGQGWNRSLCWEGLRVEHEGVRGEAGSEFGFLPGPHCRPFFLYHMSILLPALNHSPYISIPGALESGFPSNLTCSVPWACEQGTPPFFSWTGASVTSLDTSATHSSELTLIPRPQDHGTTLTCQVTFPGAGVTVESTIQLNVSCECWARALMAGDKGARAGDLWWLCPGAWLSRGPVPLGDCAFWVVGVLMPYLSLTSTKMEILSTGYR
jgi:hypothetical protein